jgi:hypothetical protein
MELQAQADCVITHAGYMRAIGAGRLDDILQVGIRQEARDLAEWRRDNGLSLSRPSSSQAAALISRSRLSCPARPTGLHRDRKASPPDKAQRFREQGYEVIIAGEDKSVVGGPLTRALGERGFRSLFLLAGPRMLETMLRDGALSRLYLTMVHRLIGGQVFHSLIGGPELGSAGRLRLSSLFFDPAELSMSGNGLPNSSRSIANSG